MVSYFAFWAARREHALRLHREGCPMREIGKRLGERDVREVRRLIAAAQAEDGESRESRARRLRGQRRRLAAICLCFALGGCLAVQPRVLELEEICLARSPDRLIVGDRLVRRERLVRSQPSDELIVMPCPPIRAVVQ